MSDYERFIGLPVNASSGKSEVDWLIIFVHILMGLLFFGWLAYYFRVLYKFNKGRNPKADYVGVTSHRSTYVEAGVAIIEAVLLVGIAIPMWAKNVDAFPKGKDVTTIKVIGQQFQWNGWYPGTNGVFVTQDRKFVTGANPFGFNTNDPNYYQNFTVIKDFYVPVNKPVVAYISSFDVIHCFAVRPMRVTQDAVPGMVIPAWFKPVKEGKYMINCAQLCGSGHAGMRGDLHVVSQAEYDKWVAGKMAAVAPPTAASATAPGK